MKQSFNKNILPYFFLAPTFILLAVFSYYAIGNAVFTSFTDSSFGVRSTFVGVANYLTAFKDDMFLTSLYNVFRLIKVTYNPLLAV